MCYVYFIFFFQGIRDTVNVYLAIVNFLLMCILFCYCVAVLIEKKSDTFSIQRLDIDPTLNRKLSVGNQVAGTGYFTKAQKRKLVLPIKQNQKRLTKISDKCAECCANVLEDKNKDSYKRCSAVFSVECEITKHINLVLISINSNKYISTRKTISQPAFSCSKPKTEAPEQSVIPVQSYL